MREAVGALRDSPAKSQHKTRPQGSSGGDTDALRNHRADGALEWVPGARDSQPRPTSHQRRQQRIRFERQRDERRIGSQVECATRRHRDLKERRGHAAAHTELQRVSRAAAAAHARLRTRRRTSRSAHSRGHPRARFRVSPAPRESRGPGPSHREAGRRASERLRRGPPTEFHRHAACGARGATFRRYRGKRR